MLNEDYHGAGKCGFLLGSGKKSILEQLVLSLNSIVGVNSHVVVVIMIGSGPTL